jgi:predicted outer membrane repeat protein
MFELAEGFSTVAEDFKSILISGKTITVFGVGREIDAHTSDRFFVVEKGATLVLEGVSLVNGHTLSTCTRQCGGGAIYVNGGALTTIGCTFTENFAEAGGGAILVDANGTLMATKCTFDKNAANGEGALGVFDGGSLALIDCTFSGNTASNGCGGAIGVDVQGQATLSSCSFLKPGDAIGNGQNDVWRSDGTVKFVCPAGTTGTSVTMTSTVLPVDQLPPSKQIVHCK